MDYLALQTKFAKRTLDTRASWILAGDDNKEALNDGYKEVYSKAIQDRSIQEMLKSVKTSVTMVDNTGTLPTDFLQPVIVFLKSAGSYNEIDKEDFPYRFQRVAGVNKIIFNEKPNFSVYIEYVQKITDLGNDTDESVLPSEFDNDIINYALVEYHRANRDWAEVSNELQYAEGKIGETIDQFWLE